MKPRSATWRITLQNMAKNEWRDFSTEDSKNKVHIAGSALSQALQQLSSSTIRKVGRKMSTTPIPNSPSASAVESGALYGTIFVRNPTHEPTGKFVRRASAKQN